MVEQINIGLYTPIVFSVVVVLCLPQMSKTESERSPSLVAPLFEAPHLLCGSQVLPASLTC